MKRLCVGCGYERFPDRETWMTVDLDPDTGCDVIADVRHLGMLEAEHFDEIRAVDILEHLSYRDVPEAVKGWARLLKPGGRLFIQVPAADLIMRMFVSGDEWGALRRGLPGDLIDAPLMVQTAWRLLGGHLDGDYTRNDDRWYLNAHHALFDGPTLWRVAQYAGLDVESIDINPHPNYQVWMRKP